MRNFIKWIGVIILANFAPLLVLPFVLLPVKGFWPVMGALLLCNIIARPLFGFCGGILGGMIKLSGTQWFWLVGLSLVSIIYTLVEIDASTRAVIHLLIFGGSSIYLFFMSMAFTTTRFKN